MFEDVIVQKPPAWPWYCEGGQVFVTCIVPLRGFAVERAAAVTSPAAAIARASAMMRFMIGLLSRRVRMRDGDLLGCDDACERHAGDPVRVSDVVLRRCVEPAEAGVVSSDVGRTEMRGGSSLAP